MLWLHVFTLVMFVGVLSGNIQWIKKAYLVPSASIGQHKATPCLRIVHIIS